MSYILEALKKSEQERQLGAVPRPEAGMAVERSAPRRLWPWLLSGVLLLNAAVLVWLTLRPGSDSPSAGLARDNADPASAGAAPMEPAAVAAPEPVPTPSPATSPAAQAEPDPQTQSQPAPRVTPESEPVAARAAPTPASAPRGSVRWMSEPDTAAQASPPAAATADQPETASAPHWEELSASERSGLSRPELDVHVYAEAPAQRFVLINLKRYREGERLEGGGRLVAITPDGVIIEARGVRYRVD